MKSTRNTTILILIFLLILRANNEESFTYYIIDLLIGVIAAEVIYRFYLSIRAHFDTSSKLPIPVWMLVIIYSLGSVISFVDAVFLDWEIMHSPILGLYVPISFVGMYIGNIWLGILLFKHEEYKIIGLGFCLSLVVFSILVSFNLSGSNYFLSLITQMINVIPYFLILVFYLKNPNAE